MTLRQRLRRRWIMLLAYLRPHWFAICCPHCGAVLRERSGPHMTRAMGRHARAAHPEITSMYRSYD